MTAVREQLLVELVDETGNATGSATVEAAHQEPGQLHRAFSVILRDPAGRVLLQQRAAVKTRFALRWANSCCGHPAPGESLSEAANKRLAEELGTAPIPLQELGVYAYRAADEATGRVEYEYDHVLVGDVPADLSCEPDPAEVAALGWVSAADLRASLVAEPDKYAPWLSGVIALLP